MAIFPKTFSADFLAYTDQGYNDGVAQLVEQQLAMALNSLYDNLYGNLYGNKQQKPYEQSYYGQVGRALGFTQNEVTVLVNANDSGLSFATIAALIEEHPPVLSSAMTEARRAEETAFVENVTAAIRHSGGKKPNKSALWTAATVEGQQTVTTDVDGQIVYGGVSKSPNSLYYSDNPVFLDEKTEPFKVKSWKEIMASASSVSFKKSPNAAAFSGDDPLPIASMYYPWKTYSDKLMLSMTDLGSDPKPTLTYYTYSDYFSLVPAPEHKAIAGLTPAFLAVIP